MEVKPKVSVLCTAYNHEEYIRRTIEGFLAQEVHWPIEIIIHDDASTDGTQTIIKEYIARYPTLIKGILQKENQHSKERGRVAQLLYSAACGEYIALCEGDDYWIDLGKLQRQINALENDAGAIGCFTDAYIEQEGMRTRYMDGYALAPTGIVHQSSIILGQGIPTNTFVFKNIDLKVFHEVRKLARVGDSLLFTYLTQFGYFIYQPNITGVRTIHRGGIYSMKSAVHKLKVHLETLPFMDQLSDHKYSDLIAERRRKALDQAWSEAITSNNRELAKYVWPMVAKERKKFGWNFTTTLRNFFKAFWPLPDRIYERMAH